MGGAQPLAVTMNGGVCLIVDVDRSRLQRRWDNRYLDVIADGLDEAVAEAESAKSGRVEKSIGVVGNAAEIFPELLRRGVPIDIVTDQTSAHDPLSYVPSGVALEDAAAYATAKSEEFTDRARASMARHVEAMVGFLDAGAEVFDYGNSIRGEARLGGYDRAFAFPGSCRPTSGRCSPRARARFRWRPCRAEPADIAATDRASWSLSTTTAACDAIDHFGRSSGSRSTPYRVRLCWLRL